MEELTQSQALPLNVTMMVDDWPISMEVDTVAVLT